MLVLFMALGALLGLLVLWFAVVRHERTVRRRARRRAGLRTITRPEGMLMSGIGAAADESAAEPVAETVDVAAGEVSKEEEDEPAADDAPKQASPAKGQRKLTDEILSRVESELAGRETPGWKDLAALVHREYGVTVHPSSIQKAVKRRRLAAQAEVQTEVQAQLHGAEAAQATA